MIPGRLVALVLLALALPAAAQVPAGSLGPLVPLLPLGPQPGGWVGEAVGDGYQIVKSEGAGPAWVALPAGQGEPGRRAVAVTVEAAPGAAGGAGLLYALDPSGSYYAFVREGPQSVALYFHGPGGRQRNIAVTSSGFAADRPMQLAIVENGRAFALLVDGQRVGQLQTPEGGRGRVGIVALGAGRFTFRNFRLD